jgi:CheY-like chemotaxis protein
MALILIIDDDSQERLSFRSILEDSGHRILEADSKSLGIKIIKHKIVDCIFFNINMPEINGFRFLIELPELLRNKSVILSPGTSIAPIAFIRQLARCNGAVGALKTPVKAGPLLQILEQSLGK